ncbi:hypothetical protein ACFLXB_06865 [Chloroflexota bacterium]
MKQSIGCVCLPCILQEIRAANYTGPLHEQDQYGDALAGVELYPCLSTQLMINYCMGFLSLYK